MSTRNPESEDAAKTSRRRRRRSSPHRRQVGAVGLVLAALLLFCWLAIAGVHHPTRALLHAALGAVLLSIALLPDRALQHAGATLPLASASAALLAAVAAGLLALPRPLLGFFAPGILAAHPYRGFFTLSLDAEATMGELCDLLLPIGMLLATSVWAAAWWRRSGLERAMRWALVAVAAVGTLHALSGSTELFGLVKTSLAPPQRFFAPFINPNHFGSALILLLPSAMAAACSREMPPLDRALWGGLSVAVLGLLVWVGSSGALVAGAVVVGLGLWRLGGLVPGRLLALALALIALLVPWFGWFDQRAAVTFGDRVATWGLGLKVLSGHWLAGVGGGNFEAAIQPGLTTFAGWAHAHNDLVEWAVELGLLGLIALLFAARKLWPAPSRWGPRADVLTLGLVGLGVHALVDFPLQIPALSMAAAALLALRRVAFEPRQEVAPRKIRWIVLGALALELGAAAWEARTAAVDAAVASVRTQKTGALGAEATLRRFAPWRPELLLLQAWEAERAGDLERAVAVARTAASQHADDPYTLRVSARILARCGLASEAMDLYDRSIARFPGDWRTWVARALDAPPERQIEAWKDAFAAGAPGSYLSQAWEALPVGLVWLEAAEARDARFAAHLGAFLESRRDYATASLAYEVAMRKAPGEPPPPGYVRALLALGRLEEAERFLGAAISAWPHDVRLQQQQAELLEARGRYAEAAAAWLPLASRNPSLLVNALRATERAQGPLAALELAERRGLVGQRPTPLVVLELARLQREAGQKGRCAAMLYEADLPDHPKFGARARQLLQSCEGS